MTVSPPAFIKVSAGLILVSLVILINCAEVQPPSGGEPDKRAPRVDSTSPANGSTSVATGNTIDIYFSERVQSSAGRQVYISPRPAQEPKLKWHSDRLSITLAEPFAPNQTTVVSLGSGVTDLRNNRLDSSMTIAFSTGTSLDSGRVAGTVLSNGAGQGGMLVGLWDAARISDSTILDSLYPDYLTVTDAKGNFTLKYLPDNQYRLIAFVDRNRDERLNARREAFALPDRPVSVGGEIPIDSLVMSVTTADTSGAGIISATFSLSGMARIRLSGEFPLDHLKSHLSDAVMIPLLDTTQSYSAQALLESARPKANSLTLAFGRLPAGDYRLVCPLRPDSSVAYEPLTVRDNPDTEPPTIVDHTPGDRAIFASDVAILLSFSEPIDTAKAGDETIQLVRSDSIPITTTATWTDVLHCGLKPVTILDGASYTVRIAEFEIMDLAGNKLGDSLTTYNFRTLNTDSLGQVSGTVAIRLRDKATDPAVLIFKEISNKFVDTLAVKGRDFVLNLPAGKYLLTGFLDSNRDGSRTDGALSPFRFGETSAIHPDTIAVRARFETTGIELIFK